jgi:sugar O-acyltransferase (sialic acid O-acetyltransferase NeuD family)
MQKYVIYGASGHGKVVADILEKSNASVIGFLDDDSEKWGQDFFGYKVFRYSEFMTTDYSPDECEIIIAIGDNLTRKILTERLAEEGFKFGKAIHPSAVIGKNVSIGEGTVLMANSVINAETQIGIHCIINTSVSVDHDGLIGDFVHLSPGCHLGGGVKVGELSWIGLGASVIHNIEIGRNSIIGAGTVVIRPVPCDKVVVGNPSRFIKSRANKKIRSGVQK